MWSGKVNNENIIIADAATELICGWLASVDRVRPEQYTALKSFDDAPEQARADSCFWCDSFFSQEANPHDPCAEVRWQIHLSTADTFDLLRCEYAVGGIRLEVIESRNFTLIQVHEPSADEILKHREPERGAEVLRIAGVLFNMPGNTTAYGTNVPAFRLLPTISGECVFSTNAGADPFLLPLWSERVDAGIHAGKIFFLYYKKISQLAGFLNAQEWFEDDVRSRFASQQRAP
jgi:hypothetical protein